MKCKVCGSKINPKEIGKQATGEFCSISCASSHNVSKVNNNELKQSTCCECGEEIGIKKKASPKLCKCDECKRIRKSQKRPHKGCGQLRYNCKRPDICKKYQVFPALIKYFGMNESKIGTPEIYEEFERIRNLVYEDYGEKELSLPEMVEKYGHYNSGNFVKILHSLGVETRNGSESGINAYKNGKVMPPCSPQYEHGGHKTGNNKQVFYRSSYELDYAQELDKKQIDYNMEGLRILYGDSQKQIQRIAIPDFYLPETNTIVEIKSSGTYDEQNMRDKFQAYKEHGLNCKLVLDKQEIQ